MNNSILPTTAAILFLLVITLFGGKYWIETSYLPNHPEIHRGEFK